MDPITISLISFGFILTGALSGFYFGNRLPEHHLSSESKEAVKMGWGIVATMSALVLGLLVASAKSNFDIVNNECAQTSAHIVFLDHTLELYGTQADTVRENLRIQVAASIKRDWPNAEISSSVPAGAQFSNLMQNVHDSVTKLKPANDEQRILFAQAETTSRELATGRWLIIEQSKNNLPAALFIALVFWLTLLFLGLGIFSPHNRTVFMMLILCSFSVSIAIFLISDMSHPLRGVIEVSSGSIVDAFERIDRH